jgi:plasmid replication initiation protein
MPVMARRLISFAIFTVQLTRPSNMRVSLHIHNVASMFRFDKTKRYEEIRQAICTASNQKLQYEQEDGTITKIMPWLTYCKLDPKNNILTIKINKNLYDYVLNIRQSAGFSIILLSDLLKLESQYALRWFEIIMSRSGHADKNNSFFVRYTITEIRDTFSLEQKYNQIRDFKKRVIDNPIAEINKKNLGYNIVPEYRYTGKSLTSVFLHCKIIIRKADKDESKADGDESISELIKLNIYKYYICRQEAENILHIQNFESQEAYQMEVTRKAIELLIERVQNE